MKRLFCLLGIFIALVSQSPDVGAEPYKEVVKSYNYSYNKINMTTSAPYNYRIIMIPASAYITNIIDSTVSNSWNKIIYKRTYFFNRTA